MFRAVVRHHQGVSGSVWVLRYAIAFSILLVYHLGHRLYIIHVYQILTRCTSCCFCHCNSCTPCLRHSICFILHKVFNTLIIMLYILDTPPNRSVFSCNSDGSRSSLMIVYCRNMYEPLYRIKKLCKSVHCVSYFYYVILYFCVFRLLFVCVCFGDVDVSGDQQTKSLNYHDSKHFPNVTFSYFLTNTVTRFFCLSLIFKLRQFAEGPATFLPRFF
jgi:hypothetical protein